jgi:hypothetical protein
MRLKIPGAMVLTLALMLALPVGTAAAREDAPTINVKTACGTEELNSVHEDKSKLSAAEIAGVSSLLKARCNDKSTLGLSKSAAANGSVNMSIVYTNLTLFISSSAWGWPYGTKKPLRFLSCTYHAIGSPWTSCGYVQLTSYGSTGTISFCPAPGRTWEGYAGVIDSKGNIYESDYAKVYAA